MATYVGGSHYEVSSSFYRRPPTTTTTSSTASSVSANMGPPTTTTTSTVSSVSANTGPANTTMGTFSKASEGLEGVLVWTFTTIKDMQGTIDSYGMTLEASGKSPYLIFRPVTTKDLNKIERARENGGIDRGVRLTHYVDWEVLIVKVPTKRHEIAHAHFGQILTVEAGAMGLKRELINVGATKYQVRRASKEGDTAFLPRSMRPREGDWPTIVIEAGWSESIRKLRQDAGFWLEDSGGDVKIVLLISVVRRRGAKTIVIEKWENGPVPANRPATRFITGAVANAQMPTKIQTIRINSNSNIVNGAPLTLEFGKIFLRQAVPPLEHDFTLTGQDLLEFGSDFWACLR